MVTILLADDSDYIKDLLKVILTEAGHRVIGDASNGDEAVAKYKELSPDVALMDIVMEPGITAKTGLDALKEIIKFDPQANVVICSGLDEQMLINKSMRMGAKAFVTKPIEPEKLLETVMMCTDLRIIAEIGNIGTGRAATVLSKLANQPIMIDVAKLETDPPHLIARLNGEPDRVVKAVHMKLQSENDCDSLLVFELSEAEKISDIMTEKCGLKGKRGIQESAIKEMGSNMICAFFGAVADFSELALVPSAPTMVTDSFEAVVDVFLAKMAVAAKSALIFQIRLTKEAGSAEGVFIMIPSPKFEKQLIAAGKRWLSTAEVPVPIVG